jgi:hypoxanthine phosphoribosyltransferase
MRTVHADIARIIISREQIAQRIKELGAQLRTDLSRDAAAGEIVIVPILTGAIIFVADLMRELPLKMRTSVVTVSSYPGATTRTKGAQIAGAIPTDLAGKHVIIVDDILDSGGTIRLIREEVSKRSPASMRCCVLLRKKIPSAMQTPCEYVGFDIPDEFVVGYGLDYDNLYRNLPEIGVLKEEAR